MYAHAAVVAGLALTGLAAGHPQRALIGRFVSDDSDSPDAHPSDAHPPVATTAHRPVAGPLVVGLVTAVLLGALAARIHPGLVLAAACWLALCSVPLAFIDAAVRRLPDVLTGAAFAGTVLLLLAAAANGGHWHVLTRAVLGGIALAGFFLVLAVISPSGMGMGDVKAAAGLGAMLAWRGWTTLIAGGFAGFLLAAVYSIALLISGRITRKQQIPVGPFMITGAFLVILTWHSYAG